MSDTISPTPSGSDSRDADWEALARYMAGESPEDESRRVEAWLAADPADAALLAAMDALLVSDSSVPTPDALRILWRPSTPIRTEDALRSVHRRADAASIAPDLR